MAGTIPRSSAKGTLLLRRTSDVKVANDALVGRVGMQVESKRADAQSGSPQDGLADGFGPVVDVVAKLEVEHVYEFKDALAITAR